GKGSNFCVIRPMLSRRTLILALPLLALPATISWGARKSKPNPIARPSPHQNVVLNKPYLSSAMQEKLQSLPYGLDNQIGLFLRFRHVGSVQFYGAGTLSQYGFKDGQSLLK